MKTYTRKQLVEAMELYYVNFNENPEDFDELSSDSKEQANDETYSFEFIKQ